MKELRVLILENSVGVTGALKSITRSAHDLRNNFEFHFIIPSKARTKYWITGMGFTQISELPFVELSKSIRALFLYIPFLITNTFRLSRYIKRNEIALIHINDVYNLLPVFIRFLGNATPYVCHVRFLPDRFPPWLFDIWIQLHLKYASKVIAVSRSVEAQLPRHPKVCMIYNELPLNEKYRGFIVQKQKTSTFLYLSNFIKGKGQDFALQAFALIHNKIPHWKLRFVGGDMGLQKNKEFRRELLQNARLLGIFDKTEWIGFTQDVELEYKQADIVLNFSESESFSITCLESLYYGRPVIATECGGPSEIIEHNKTGKLVPNRKVNAMAEAMLELALDPKIVKEMGNFAAIHVRDRFSIEKTTFVLKGVYMEAITR